MPVLPNPRHEKFAEQLAQGRTATEAYVLAGFKPSRRNASRLKSNEDVAARVCEIQQAGANSAEVSVASLLAELEDARAKATTLGQLSAAVRATAEKARISGLLIERQQIEINQSPFDNDTSIPEVLQYVAEKHSPAGAVLLAMVFEEVDQLPEALLSMHRQVIAEKLELIRDRLTFLQASVTPANNGTAEPKPVQARIVDWRPPRPDCKR